ncbi:MAG: DUF4062 domain-containing protein [Deferribacterales bacterium]
MNWMGINMDKLHQVFLSSTFRDLQNFRADVIDGLLKAGFHPKCMEYFPAASSSPKDYIVKSIDSSDLFILLLNNRYGEFEDCLGGISYTHFEYHYAMEQKKQILCFIDEKVAHSRLENEQQKGKLAELKAEILKTSLIKPVKFKNISEAQLTKEVLSSLAHSTSNALTYWVKNSQTQLLKDPYTIDSIVSLTGDFDRSFEIPMSRIISIFDSWDQFTYKKYKEQLEYRENLGRQESFRKKDILNLIKNLITNGYLTFDVSGIDGEVIFKPTEKPYHKNKKEFIKMPDSLLK